MALFTCEDLALNRCPSNHWYPQLIFVYILRKAFLAVILQQSPVAPQTVIASVNIVACTICPMLPVCQYMYYMSVDMDEKSNLVDVQLRGGHFNYWRDLLTDSKLGTFCKNNKLWLLSLL